MLKASLLNNNFNTLYKKYTKINACIILFLYGIILSRYHKLIIYTIYKSIRYQFDTVNHKCYTQDSIKKE